MRGLNILHQQVPLLEIAQREKVPVETLSRRLHEILGKLAQVRSQRPRPHLDDKIVVAWNGLMIASLARASVLLGETIADEAMRYKNLADSAASMIQNRLWDTETKVLRRCWRDGRSSAPGFAEDYTGLVHGLLELYDATFEVRWLRWADELQSAMDEQFWDEAGGGYFQTAVSDQSIILRMKDHHDGAEPSANAQAAANLLRLALLLPDEERRERGLRTIQAFRPQWTESSWSMPAMLMAMEWELSSPARVMISGDPGSDRFGQFLRAARPSGQPRRGVLAATDSEGAAWLRERVPEFPTETDTICAYVCIRASSIEVVPSPRKLEEVLWS